jgi:hypothetical protein
MLIYLNDDSRKLDTKDLACLWRQRVSAFALRQIHAVESESMNFYKTLTLSWRWPWDSTIDEQSCSGTSTVFNVCIKINMWKLLWTWGILPTARICAAMVNGECIAKHKVMKLV